jgi:hypothetical protein
LFSAVCAEKLALRARLSLPLTKENLQFLLSFFRVLIEGIEQSACTELNPVYRRLLKMTLERLQFVAQQIHQLDQEIASLSTSIRMQ